MRTAKSEKVQKVAGKKKRLSRTKSSKKRPGGEYLAQSAYRDLRDQIMGAQFQPGEHLKEEDLVEKLGVSRSVVRQALVRLAAEGLVQDDPKKGKFVAQLSEESLAKLVPIRIALEQLAVRQAIAHIQKKDEEELKEMAARLKEPDITMVEQSQLDIALHRKIWRLTQNDELERLLIRVVTPFHLMYNVNRTSPLYRHGSAGLSLEQILLERERNAAGHQLLVEAICRRKVEEATQAIADHITANWSTSPEEYKQKVGKLIKKYLDG